MIKLNDNLSIGTQKPTRETDIFGQGQVYKTLADIPANMLHEWMTSVDFATGLTWRYERIPATNAFHWVKHQTSATTDTVIDKSRILGQAVNSTTDVLNWLLDKVVPPKIDSFHTTATGLRLLSFAGNPADQVKDPEFTFHTSGAINNLTISDNVGNPKLDIVPSTPQPVKFIGTYPSNPDVVTDVEWTLTADGKLSKVQRARWVFPSFVGKSMTSGVPTEAEILATSKLVKDTRIAFKANPSTLDIEYGWFAVEHSVSKLFTKWQISALNKGDIGSSGFISGPTTVVVDGLDYDVYVYNYPSKVALDVTLS